MFKFHNHITIRCGGIEQISPNEVFDIKTPLLSGHAYAKFIVMRHNGVKIFKSAKIESINTDITKGQLQAEYSAELSGSEGTGQTFSEFGLSYDGETLVNAAFFKPVTKEAGKALYVSVTVYVSISEDSAQVLTGGDNPLAAVFLGRDPLDGAAFKFAESGCNHLNTYIGRKLSSPASETPELGIIPGEGFYISCTVSPDTKEVVATLDGKEALRYFTRQDSLGVRVASTEAFDDGCAPLHFDDVESLSSAVQNGVQIHAPALRHTTDKIYRLDSHINFSAGLGAVLTDESTGNYAALATGREIMLLGLKDGRVEILRRYSNPPYGSGKTPDNEQGFMLTYSGYIGIFSDTLKIYAENGEVQEYAVKRGEQNVLIFEGGGFHYLKIASGALERYKIINGVCTLIERTDALPGAKIFKNALAAVMISNADVKAWDTASELPVLASLIGGVKGQAGGVTDYDLSDGLLYLKTEQGYDKLAAFRTGEIMDVLKTSRVTLSSDFCLTQGSVGQLAVFDRITRVLNIVSGTVDAAAVRSIASVGDYLLVLDGEGRIQTYYKNRKAAYIYHGALKAGPVYASFRGRLNPFEGAQSARIIFTIRF